MLCCAVLICPGRVLCHAVLCSTNLPWACAVLYLPVLDVCCAVLQLRTEYDSRGQLVFRGPRLRIGLCEGVPRTVMPDHLGR
jgi:hypothetical protein